MPIVWSISLSDSQISLLKAFADYSDKQEEIIKNIEKNPRKITNPSGTGDYETPWLKFSHFISHLRPMLRDKLIEHSTIKYGPNLQWIFNTYKLTEKGWCILLIVEIELEEMREKHLLGDGLPNNQKARSIRDSIEVAKKKKRIV